MQKLMHDYLLQEFRRDIGGDTYCRFPRIHARLALAPAVVYEVRRRDKFHADAPVTEPQESLPASEELASASKGDGRVGGGQGRSHWNQSARSTVVISPVSMLSIRVG